MTVTVPSSLKTVSLPITSRDLAAQPLTKSEIAALLAAYANGTAGTDTVTVAFATGLFQYVVNRFAVADELAYHVGHSEAVLADEYGTVEPQLQNV